MGAKCHNTMLQISALPLLVAHHESQLGLFSESHSLYSNNVQYKFGYASACRYVGTLTTA
eukprot:5311902-Amphidinium_carterae.1